MTLTTFTPQRYEESVYTVDFRKEYEAGVRGLIFDIDNTLVPHGHAATKEAIAFFAMLREIGFTTCLISNNGEKRAGSFAKAVGSLYLPNASKPSRRAYRKAMELMGTELSDTLFLGDQILTDVWGAKRLGMKHILVKPIDRSTDPLQVKIKRIFEGIILRKYTKNQ